MEQKNNKPVTEKSSDAAQEKSNVLGLDADQSSVEIKGHTYLNTDNDSVSSSPCSAEQFNNDEHARHSSPLDEK